MEAIKCRVSEVVSIKDKAITVSFQNGELIPEQASSLKCGLFVNKKTKQQVAAVETDDNQVFSGCEPLDDNPIVMNLIAIRNKKTNEVRLIPTQHFTLSPTVEVQQSSAVSAVTQEDKDRLSIKFGSKRKQRAVQQYSRNRVDAEVLEKQLTQASESVVLETTDLEPVNKPDDTPEYLPPLNRNAPTLDQVYNLHDIVSVEELESLHEEAAKIMENPEDYKNDKFTAYFLHHLPLFSNNGKSNSQVLERYSALLYADCLIKFLQLVARLFRKKIVNVCPYSEVVNTKIYNVFSIKGPSGRTRPNSLKDKAICYLIVLGLILTDFRFDLNPLVKDLKISLKRMQQFSYQVGAVPVASSTFVSLKLPLTMLQQSPKVTAARGQRGRRK